MRNAVAALRRATDVKRVSSVYRTTPMYVEDQPPFLNAALIAETELGPRALLAKLKEIESQVGRQPRERYGPREIDLDLIAYGVLSYTYAGGERPLNVPHPKTVERRFVLMPLCEIAPDFKLVGLGIAKDLLLQTKEQVDDVVRLDDAQL